MAEHCHCGKTRTKHITGLSSWLCHQCWKIQKSEVYYQCGNCPNCVNALGDLNPQVCESCACVPSTIAAMNITDALTTSWNIIEREIAACKTAEEKVDYLYLVNLNFYGYWIANVETTEIGSRDHFRGLVNRYREMQLQVLEKQSAFIDETQLELQVDQSTFDDTIKDHDISSATTSALYSQLTKEWMDLVGAKKEAMEFANIACDHGDKCPCWKKILFINNLFKDHFINPIIQKTDDEDDDKISNAIYIDLFQKCLSGYSAVSLLDGVYHVESMHDNGYNAVKCECEDLDKECIGDLLRKLRRRERGEDEEEDQEKDSNAIFEQFMNGLDDEGRLIMEVTAKMHDALCHRYDNGKEVISDEKENEDDTGDFKVRSLKWWKKRSPSTLKGNKFVNEVMERKQTKQKENGGRMDDLHDVLIEKGINISDSNQFMKYLHQNNYDSETVLDDMMDDEDVYNEYKDSNLFSEINRSQFYAKTIKKHLGGEHHDEDNLPVFSFGSTIWMHWLHYKDWGQYNQPKYHNLKEECVSNQIYSISMVLFTQILRKAMMYQRSRKGRKLKARNAGLSNDCYNIPTDLPITISHVFVLLLYCNFTKLQYEYKKKGCRKGSDEQTWDEFKALNSEIGHWYKLLYEVIVFFGTACSPKDTFYTGLNVRLNFSTFAPIWRSPFSTTVEIDVANRFSDGTGIVIKLVPSTGSMDTYFDVEWLSDYDFEKERLFHHAFDLQIADIRYVELGKFVNNQRYLRAFALFSGLFSGHFICHLLRKKKKQPKAEKVLLDLITVYKENNGMSDGNGQSERVLISLYIQQMFFNLIQQFRSKRKHFVIKSEYEKIGSALKTELFSFDVNDDDDYNPFSKIQTSPFFNTVCPSLYIQTPIEYIWIVHGQQLIELKRGGMRFSTYSDQSYGYRISPSKSVQFKLGLQQPIPGENRMAFYFKVLNTSFRGTFNGQCSVRVEELNWFSNEINMNTLRHGSRDGYIAFAACLLKDVQSLTFRVATRFW